MKACAVSLCQARLLLAFVLSALLVACKPGAGGGPGATEGRQSKDPRAAASGPRDVVAVTPAIPADPNDTYEDVTAKAGISFVQQYCDTRIANILESNGSGAAVLDIDNDGLMDLFLVNPGPLEGVTHHAPGTKRGPNCLYRNKGDGTFEDVTARAGVAGDGYAVAAVAADYDNDGWTDLYVVTVGRNILFHNRGDGTFEDVTARAGVGHAGTGIGAVFADIDNDGWLDLFVANYLTYDPSYTLYFNPDSYPGPLSYQGEMNVLYRNRGDGTFEDVSRQAGVQLEGHRAMSVTAFDCNGDGFQDFYICNDATPNLLLVNDRHGRFTDQAKALGVAFNALGEPAGSMVAALGDYNGDLLPDILVSRLGYGSLYTAKPGGGFEDLMMASGLGSITAPYVGWGANFLDYDNDGDLDAFIANGDAHHLAGSTSLLLENRGKGTFVDAADSGGGYFRTKVRARGSVVLDYDNDGRMDLLVTAMADRPFLLHNRCQNRNHWITLKLEGTKSNRDGFGTVVTLVASGRTQRAQYRCQSAFLGNSDPRLHFGLGAAPVVERLELRWPSGTTQTFANVKTDQILKVKEPAP
jgi:hypothetical protein